jgi:hypothetical protein
MNHCLGVYMGSELLAVMLASICQNGGKLQMGHSFPQNSTTSKYGGLKSDHGYEFCYLLYRAFVLTTPCASLDTT